MNVCGAVTRSSLLKMPTVEKPPCCNEGLGECVHPVRCMVPDLQTFRESVFDSCTTQSMNQHYSEAIEEMRARCTFSRIRAYY